MDIGWKNCGGSDLEISIKIKSLKIDNRGSFFKLAKRRLIKDMQARYIGIIKP